MSLIWSASFGFAINTINDIQNTGSIELIVALSSTNATKTVGKEKMLVASSFSICNNVFTRLLKIGLLKLGIMW